MTHLTALPLTERQRVLVAGDFNLDISGKERACLQKLRASGGGEALERCGLRRVVPHRDPGTTLDAIKKFPGGAVDNVLLHTHLLEGVASPVAHVVCFDEQLMALAAQQQPRISREWLREGLCTLGSAASSGDGTNANENAIHAMKRLGWSDHRPLIVDIWAKDLAMKH